MMIIYHRLSYVIVDYESNVNADDNNFASPDTDGKTVHYIMSKLEYFC